MSPSLRLSPALRFPRFISYKAKRTAFESRQAYQAFQFLKALQNMTNPADPALKESRGDSPPSGLGPRKRPTTGAVRDENGFKLRRQAIDSQNLVASEHFQGMAPTPETAAMPKDRTLLQEEQDGATYVIDGPVRRVTPYYFTYLTYCKLRWRDRKLLDVFVDEFRDRDEEHYREALTQGRVFLNDKVAGIDSIIRNGDLISHRIHRHEPPVTSRPVKIVFEDADIVAIDKPAGIPVHPTGRYRYNTIVKIFEVEKGMKVNPCNRLDRLTSGLMFLAKTAKGADKMADALRNRDVSKEYVARVVGEFPLGEVACDEKLKTINPKIGFNKVDAEGKESRTTFRRISYDPQSNTSIVKCKPYSGRTHQIRVHLQYLGHPIANDPIYSNLSVWGPAMGKDGECDVQHVESVLHTIGKTVAAQSWAHRDCLGEVISGEHCPECGLELYTDPGPNDLDLWLHAYKYEALDSSWSYQTEYPDWALEAHQPYMQMALAEAHKCEGTTTAFSVGAVLVHNAEVLATGYSRELPGNTHAEQSAMEKYFARQNTRELPPGTVLYTTMEPCSERLSGNVPCVDRILEHPGIQTCFVGVLEPDTFVQTNVGAAKLSAAGVEYIHIPGFKEACLAAAVKGHPTPPNAEAEAESESKPEPEIEV